jgi:hypothetical protein
MGPAAGPLRSGGKTMDLKEAAAIPGALVGAVVLGVLGYLLLHMGLTWILLVVMAGVVLVGYLLAHFFVGKDLGEFFRGFLVGINAAGNAVLGIAFYGSIFGVAAGVVIGLVLGVVNLLAAFKVLANGEFFQGILGWLNFLFPMSWLVTGLGLLFLVASAIGTLILGWGGQGAAPADQPFFKITGTAADLKTGTFFIRGGFVANLNPLARSAFNMGSFAFAKRDAPPDMHVEHEAGHTLNLAAFGSLFHFIGAIDENVTGGGAQAFSERLAESNNPNSANAGDIVKMWI